MKWVGYGWAVVTGLISVVIAFAVVNAFEEMFQRVVIDLLLIIYTGIRSAMQMQGLVAMDAATIARDRFMILLKNGGDLRFENEDHREQVKEENETINRSRMKNYIHSGFVFIIFLIALINLFGAL